MDIHRTPGRSAATLALALVALGTSGCSSLTSARQGAELLAAYTDAVQKDLGSFKKSRDALAKARHHNIDLLELNAFELETNVAEQRDLWLFANAKDPRAMGLDHALQATDKALASKAALAELHAAHAARLASVESRVASRKAELEQTAKLLAQLAQPPDFVEELGFYRAFFKDVQRRLEELEEQASLDAEAAVEDVEKKETPDAESPDEASKSKQRVKDAVKTGE